MKLAVLCGGLIVWSAVAATSAGAAGAPLGNELYVDCQQNLVICYPYLLGVWDGLFIGTRGEGICEAGGVNAAQLRLVFLQFSRTHPNALSLPEAEAAVLAILNAFGCNPPEPSK